MRIVMRTRILRIRDQVGNGAILDGETAILCVRVHPTSSGSATALIGAFAADFQAVQPPPAAKQVIPAAAKELIVALLSDRLGAGHGPRSRSTIAASERLAAGGGTCPM